MFVDVYPIHIHTQHTDSMLRPITAMMFAAKVIAEHSNFAG